MAYVFRGVSSELRHPNLPDPLDSFEMGESDREVQETFSSKPMGRPGFPECIGMSPQKRSILRLTAVSRSIRNIRPSQLRQGICCTVLYFRVA